MLCNNRLIETRIVFNVLSPLYSLNIFRELALRLTRPPDWLIAFEDIVNFFEGTPSGLGVREENVEGHCCA